ncbi:MAG: hypothetical protein M3R17_13040 [Bacteroidota bacterium]|nr:hypothetical protein [Bacteroidota bacterium]
MIEQPYSGRAVLTDTLGELQMVISSKKNWLIIIFMSFWICGWLWGLITVSSKMLFQTAHIGANLIILAWLVMWIIGGFFAINVVVWMIFGKEIITVGNGILTIKRTGTLFKKAKSYDLPHISNMHAKEQSLYMQRSNSVRSMLNRGAINFEYGMKTIRFGDLDEAEARHIIELLKTKKFIH